MIEILIINSYDIDDICTYYLSVTTVLSEHEKKIIPKFGMIFLGDFLANGQIKFHPEFGDEIWSTASGQTLEIVADLQTSLSSS